MYPDLKLNLTTVNSLMDYNPFGHITKFVCNFLNFIVVVSVHPDIDRVLDLEKLELEGMVKSSS